jgi:hypothetical protein
MRSLVAGSKAFSFSRAALAGSLATLGHSVTIATLCQELGLEVVDTGPIAMSLHLEHMTLLWIKMARVQGAGAGFVWAQLLRPREAV